MKILKSRRISLKAAQESQNKLQSVEEVPLEKVTRQQKVQANLECLSMLTDIAKEFFITNKTHIIFLIWYLQTSCGKLQNWSGWHYFTHKKEQEETDLYTELGHRLHHS